ncbi:MAG TPA: FtsX-like permease family protein [Anaerolineae bacterium]|nr:FtsX-like permease family protein [Anaerolineae bacterium]
MRLHHITWKNIREHPGKIALLIVGVAIGVATVVSLYSISRAMYVDIQDKIDEYGANMVIVPKSKSLPLTYAGVTVGGLQYESSSLTENDLAKIRTIKNSANVKVVAPKLLGIVPVNGKKAVIAGVRFQEEFELKKWWEIKRGVRPSEKGDILLGGKAARQLGVDIGDTVNIAGNRFTVAGILGQVGTQEDELVYVDLKRAQSILRRPGEVSLAEVAAWCKNCPIDDIVKQVKQKIPGAKISAVRQAAEARDAVTAQFNLFSIILSATMGVVAMLIIFTSSLSAVRERRREIGILRAIGYRKTHISYVILLESAMAGIIAGAIGYLTGFFSASKIAPVAVGIDVGVGFNPILLAVSVGGVMLIALVASLYPAIFAARLDPSEAINSL